MGTWSRSGGTLLEKAPLGPTCGQETVWAFGRLRFFRSYPEWRGILSEGVFRQGARTRGFVKEMSPTIHNLSAELGAIRLLGTL